MSAILFLAHRAPYPPNRGDRIRSYHVLRHLAGRARVHLVALDEEGAAPPPVLAATLASWTVVRRTRSRARATVEALRSGQPVSLTAFAHRDVMAAVERVLATHPIAATYVFSGQMAQYLTGREPAAIVDFVDVDSAKFAQMADGARWPLRALLRREAALLGAVERDVARRAAATLFVSDAEAALFRAQGGEGRILAVENGVDTVAYDPATVAPQPLARPTVVFTGQMDYAPNVTAAVRLARQIMPRVRRRCPEATLAIVGRAPAPAVRGLASRHVMVTGEVPDTRPWLAAGAVCAAPLTLARGIQNKVLEAMAMGRPVVVSAEAAEGIDHARTIRVADTDDAFADAIAALLRDPAAAAALGEEARRQVERRYGWAARLAPLDDLLGLDAARAAA